jgi:excisionase family DNA binding protein
VQVNSRLLTLDEVAGVLRCSRATVKRRVQAGLLPVYRDGRLVRVRTTDLDSYVAAQVSVARPGGCGQPGGVELFGKERLWD